MRKNLRRGRFKRRTRESREHPCGSGKNNGKRGGNGSIHGEREDGVC